MTGMDILWICVGFILCAVIITVICMLIAVVLCWTLKTGHDIQIDFDLNDLEEAQDEVQ